MIRRLYLRNVGPFRGEHVIELGAGAYAVVARHECDPRRSNAIGKSMLAETIRFCVTGQWPSRRGDADGWISTGERDACAALFLEDGAAIERKKVRGKAREARAKTPGTEMREAFNDDATTAMIRHLGFESAAEFVETCYVGQKRADAFMMASPGDRLAIVSGWLGLASAERATKRADGFLDDLTRNVDRAVAERDRLRTMAEEAIADPAADREAAAKARLEATTLEGKLEVVMGGIAAMHAAAESKRITARGLELRAEVDALAARPNAEALATAKAAADEASSAVAIATREERARAKTAAGQFDGKCPVAPIECPATKTINASRLATKRAHASAAEVLAATKAAAEKTHEAHDRARHLDREHERRERAMADLRADLRRDADKVAGAKARMDAAMVVAVALEAANLDHASSLLQDRLKEAFQEAGLAEGRASAAEAATGRVEAARAKLAEAEDAVVAAIAQRTLTAAARSCATAAQRRVAERALAAIERGANAALEEAGVETRLRARWEREGKDPAKHCEACGASFPTSKKVKECERCGAHRGTHQIQRLDLVAEGPSSDGLDDLGGAAWQHAAGAWLLRARQSPWSTCILDEPTAGLDHPSRQGLVRYLGSAMRRGLFRQTIVISHHAETVESLGRKIVITCAANGDRSIAVT